MEMPLSVMAGDGRTRTPTDRDMWGEDLEQLVAELNGLPPRAASLSYRWHRIRAICEVLAARVYYSPVSGRLGIEYARPGDVWEVTRGSS